MASKYLSIEKILALLQAAPLRLAELTVDVDPARLHAPPAEGEWSVNEILAHLRACSDVWGDRYIAAILDEDAPTIRALNPRTWIKETDYPEQAFQPSLRVFTEQRDRLLARLTPLSPEEWLRTNTLVGAGRPLMQTLISHADGLARHERSHLKQIARILADGN